MPNRILNWPSFKKTCGTKPVWNYINCMNANFLTPKLQRCVYLDTLVIAVSYQYLSLGGSYSLKVGELAFIPSFGA